MEIENDLGYSEYTPGEGIMMRCNKGHWTMGGPESDEDKVTLKTNLVDAAQECADFQVGDPRVDCPKCVGTGQVWVEIPATCQSVQVPCGKCGGTKLIFPE